MASGAASIDAYLEYRRIVGSDDGGKIMSEKEFESYKKNVLPKRLENRLYVNWVNPNGLECKAVGPETMCFCMHRYKEHLTDFESLPHDKSQIIRCKCKGCKCKSFSYMPWSSGAPIRCTCKHTADLHNVYGKKTCTKAGCSKCTGFTSSYTCNCTEAYSKHKMTVEGKVERENAGKRTGIDTGYAAMGGITGFSSLADGYMRINDELGKEELDRSITKDDHPFLRMHATSFDAKQNKRNK